VDGSSDKLDMTYDLQLPFFVPVVVLRLLTRGSSGGPYSHLSACFICVA